MQKTIQINIREFNKEQGEICYTLTRDVENKSIL